MEEIGIKLANGVFHPVLTKTNKRQIIDLTTVTDNQESVHIDLFRNKTDLEYIGSLTIENISKKKAGDATISLSLEVDDNENLKAEAIDLETGKKQALQVSLNKSNDSMHDFKIKDHGAFSDSDFGSDSLKNTETKTTEKLHENKTEDFEEQYTEKKGSFKLGIVLLLLLGIAILVFVVLLLIRSCENYDSEKPLVENESQKSEITSTSKVPIPSDEELAKIEEKNKELSASENDTEVTKPENANSTEMDQKNTTETKAESEKGTNKNKGSSDSKKPIVSENPRIKANADGSVRYHIKWGDTLWDLAETFYKDPWKFNVIAKYNNIKNPSLIIAGTYIDIPNL